MYWLCFLYFWGYQIQLSSGGLKCGTKVILQKARILMDITAN